MATITILPFPEPGHFLPTIRMARALQKRGHRVIYYSLPEVEEFFVSRGFGFFPILSDFSEKSDTLDCFAVRRTGDDLMRALVNYLCERRIGRNGLLQLLAPGLLAAKSELLLCDIQMYRCFRSIETQVAVPVVLFHTSLPVTSTSRIR